MAKSDGGFGIGTIIFCIIMWNIISDDDDNSDKAEMAIEAQQPVVEQVQEESPKFVETAKKAIEKAKQAVEEFKDEMETPDPPVEVTITEPSDRPEVIRAPDPEVDTIRPLDEADIPSTFKKL